MEEHMNGLGGALQDVIAAQKEMLAHANILAQLRRRRPVRRSKARRLAEWLPRPRFALPALAAVGACVVWWGMRPVPLTFAVGDATAVSGARDAAGSRATLPPAAQIGARLEAPADSRLPLAFSDGSSIALDRGARLRVMGLDPLGATVQLEKGRAEVSVRHQRNTHWRLQAGPFEVAVTGTRFSIDWNDHSDALTVVMSEGTVEVRGQQLAGSAPVIVTAGQRFHATARESRWTLASSSEPELAPLLDHASGNAPRVAVTGLGQGDVNDGDDAATTSGAAPAEAPVIPSAGARGSLSSPGPRSWQALARSGRYQEALQTAERGGFDRACRRLAADDLVQLGDVARLARNPARAEQAYRFARHRFPGSDRPAFALGLVAFEQRRNYRVAGKWFDTYVRHYPKGPLALEALGREMESWNRAGDTGRARRAARAYLTQAPTGPYAPLAQQIASPQN